MTCREFELERPEGPDREDVSPEALSHAESCARCGALLREHRAFATGLRALAAADAGREASPAVEQALLRAFRRDAPVVSISSVRRRATWTPWAWAAAAIALLTAGAWAYRAFRTEAPTVVPRPVAISTPFPGPREVLPVEPPAAPLRAAAHRRATHEASALDNRPYFREEMSVYAEEAEVSTDFLPLDGAERRGPMESGQLIRVQMPQAALARFGLPVLAERADVPVKADLLVGEDGLARAIRFVR